MLTVKQAAAQAGLKPGSIRKAIAVGTLEAKKFADVWMIEPVELERWLLADTHTPGRKKLVKNG